MRSFALWSWSAVAFLVIVPSAQAALDAQVVTVGGEVRERYEFRDNADFNSNAADTLSFIGSRIRLHLNYEVTPDIAAFIQFQDARLFGGEASTVSNDNLLDLHQGYVLIKNLGSSSLTVGRQELFFGDQRLVGHFGWSNVGRSFDGLRVTYMAAPVRVDVWGASTKVYGGNTGASPVLTPTSTITAVSNNDAQQFYGVYGSVKTPVAVVEPYIMYLRDTTGAATPTAITAPAATGQRRTTVGLRVDGKAISESIDFTGEGAYQLGTMEARGASPESDISAYAVALKAGYTAPIGIKPRIGVEYDRASGDGDRTDDRFETFENLFPTNHPFYGYMDYVGWRNMQAMRLSLSVKPTATSGMSLDYHRFSLAEKEDHWYAASGAVFRTTPSGNAESDLGQEIDLVAYTMIKEKLRVEAGYGRFFPGDYVKVNFPAATDASDFFYLQTSVSF
ncbi:MAG: alginate export family protein [Nitrospiria bacterium]